MKRRKFGGAALLLAFMFIIALFAGASGVAANEELPPPPLIEGSSTAPVSDLAGLLAAIQSADGQTTINLTAGITVSQEALAAVSAAYPDYVSGTTLKLFSEHNITIKSIEAIGAMFTVESGYSLELGEADGIGGGQLVLDGNRDSVNTTGALLDISGTVAMKTGAVLQNNSNASSEGLGGGAVIRSGGSLTMVETNNTNGVINNCSAKKGGGIYVDNDGTLDISGGTSVTQYVLFSNNSATEQGNGIFVEADTAVVRLGGNVGFSENDTVYLASGAVLTLKPDFNSASGKIPLKAADENTLATLIALQEKASNDAYNTNICFTPNTKLGAEKFYSIASKESTDKLLTEWYIDWTYVTLTLQAEPLIGQSFPTSQCLVYTIDRTDDDYFHTVCMETGYTSTSSLSVFRLRAGNYRISQTGWSYRYLIKSILVNCESSTTNTAERYADMKIIADSSLCFTNAFVTRDACMAFESKKLLQFTQTSTTPAS